MILRLFTCLLILLKIILISFEHPLPVPNSDASRIIYPDQASKILGEGDMSNNVGCKEHVGDNTESSQHQTQDRDRNKRLEIEEEVEVERNQFYKPLNEGQKGDYSPVSAKLEGQGKADQQIMKVNSNPAKFDVPKIKSQQQVGGSLDKEVDSRTDIAIISAKNIQSSGELNRNSNEGEYLEPLNTGERGTRETRKMRELVNTHNLSSEALDTMKKINPLTIGDQVSKMIHDRKCSSKQTISKSAFIGNPWILQNEDKVMELSSGFVQEGDELAKQRPAYEKIQPPKVVQKPCPSNDYGFSVIILAGDPLKVGPENQNKISGKNENGFKKKSNAFMYGNTDKKWPADKADGHNLDWSSEKSPVKEVRVLKNINPNVEFPVYDQDLISVPDPFNGLLEYNYWTDPLNKKENLFHGGVQSFPQHNIHARRAKINNANGRNDKNLKKSGNENSMLVTDMTDTTERTAESETSPDVPDDTPAPELEPFEDFIIDLNKTSCISWKDPSRNQNKTIV